MLLFLGSGVSIESGLPSVSEITNRLLNETFYRDPKSNSVYYATKDEAAGEAVPTDDIRDFFRLLQSIDQHYLTEIAPGFTGSRHIKSGSLDRSETTYEDLFRLSEQIKQCGSGKTDDAAIGAFVDLVEEKAGKLLSGDCREARLIDLYHLSSRSSGLLQWLVSISLESTAPCGLDLIVDLANSAEIQRLDIVTLNHDTLVEQLLTKNGIRYADGFGAPDGDVRWYDDAIYDAPDIKVRIFKLHGSINWHQIMGVQYPAILTGPDPSACKMASGTPIKALYNRPSFLSGDSKTIAYNRGVYSELFFRFHQVLREHQFMTMSGYGWGDLGVNFRLINWLERGGRNRMLILHHHPEQLEKRSLQLSEVYRPFAQKKRILLNKKWLSETSFADVRNAMRQGFEYTRSGLD